MTQHLKSIDPILLKLNVLVYQYDLYITYIKNTKNKSDMASINSFTQMYSPYLEVITSNLENTVDVIFYGYDGDANKLKAISVVLEKSFYLEK